MSRINTPINQVKLTNVATVRITKGGKRFEIACYKNKVVNYRQGIETDLSEVLQTERVFTNVSKGEFAKSKDLAKIFGNAMSEEDIIELILQKGDLQVSDLERTQQYESMARDIATWISEHGVHPVTQRPYTLPQIRQAMKQCEYTIHPTRSMKKQYLDCFKKMQTVIKIMRAKMQLQLVYPANEEDDATVKACLEEHAIVSSGTANGEIFAKDGNDNVVATLLVDPSLYRVLEDLSKQITNGRLEILKQVVMREGDSNLEQEMRENQQQQEQLDGETAATAAALDSITEPMAETTIEPAPQKNNTNNDEDDDDDDDYMASASSRKNQKKNQKKSKKAKRREKEEAEERQIRIDAEEKRRSERAETLPSNDGVATTDTDGISASKSCNTCGGAFNMMEYRAHFRSDWHRYNVKLKMKGATTPVSEQEFLLCDADAFFDGM